MGMENNDPTRRFVTRRYLDPATDPPRYVDEKLPTETVKFQGALRTSRDRAPAGTAQGSYRIAGTFQVTGGRGTYSLEITRLSLYSGSRGNAWAIRHSRQGTVDVLDFSSPGGVVLQGDQMSPIYSFGPGTVFWGWIGDETGAMGSAFDMNQSMEGILG